METDVDEFLEQKIAEKLEEKAENTGVGDSGKESDSNVQTS